MKPEKIPAALDKLEISEEEQLRLAAMSKFHGGDAILEPLRSKAARLELVYQSTGRLDSNVYEYFRTKQEADKPLIVE